MDVGPAQNAEIFRFPAAFRYIMIACSIGFLGLTAFSVSLPLIEPQGSSLSVVFTCALLFGALSLLSISCVYKSFDRVAADDEGIWYLPRNRPARFIAWTQIRSVRAKEFLKRLVIDDLAGSETIRLEYQLEDFSKLRTIVLNRTEDLRRRASSPSQLGGDYHYILLFASVFVAFGSIAAYAAYRREILMAALFFVLAAVHLFVVLALAVKKVKISPQGIYIKELGRQRSIAFGDIRDIELISVHGRSVSAAVLIETNSGEPITLNGYEGGSVALYDALHRAWSESPKNAANPTAMPKLALTGAPTKFALPVVFPADRRKWLGLMVVLAPFPIMALLAFVARRRMVERVFHIELAMIVISVALLVPILIKSPWRIALASNGLNVQYLLSRLVIPYHTIVNLELIKALSEQGKTSESIRIELQNGRVVRFGNRKSETGTLFDLLHAEWKRASFA
jgi:hypothetical protein